jgi:hypothetical protein
MSRALRLAALASLGGAIYVVSALAANGPAQRVTSTFDGKTVLPHRIHWVANPTLPRTRISEVVFLIDGKVSWIEHNPPYTYGNDGNWLVTSFLTPGIHRFAVQAITNSGKVATDRVTARVLPAPPPPARLAGRWTRTLSKAKAKPQPAGTWVLTINKIGWRITVPPGGANLIDVAYLPGAILESRGGIWTKPRPADNPTEGNGWCEDTNQPVRYRWSVTSSRLTLTLAGPKRCDGESQIWTGVWTRNG